MPNAATYSALDTLCTSIPEWNARLDELNGQIAMRQIELARLTESDRPPTRSLKNKGSTESLRPKDVNETPFASHDNERLDDLEMNPFSTPDSKQNGQSQRPGSRAAPVTPPPLSNPKFTGITRQSSQPTPPNKSKTQLRKRKTESLASAESLAPKYRTRSMIIVYYDSAVQQAFEDLVKFVSASRNAMRKGKMNVKMTEMKRAAEMEVDGYRGGDDGRAQDMLSAQKNVSVDKQGEGGPVGSTGPDLIAADSDQEEMMPRLRFVSTRQMGPSRGDFRTGMGGNAAAAGRIRQAAAGATDIFDNVDKGLEWVQGQCEHAAHQFLRDGDCSTEIQNIKRRLAEVKEIASKEMERLKDQGLDPEAPVPAPDTSRGGAVRSMQLKMTTMRKDLAAMNDLEVDDGISVDEGVEDLEAPPTLVFKRSRDVTR